MRIKLAVHMKSAGRQFLYSQGFRSSDDRESAVMSALKVVGVKYREPFFCIVVMDPMMMHTSRRTQQRNSALL